MADLTRAIKAAKKTYDRRMSKSAGLGPTIAMEEAIAAYLAHPDMREAGHDAAPDLRGIVNQILAAITPASPEGKT